MICCLEGRIRRGLGAGFVTAVLSFVSAGAEIPPGACTAHCLPEVESSGGEWDYQRRGDRCEGQHDQPLTARKVQVAGFVETCTGAEAADSSATWVLEWSEPPAGPDDDHRTWVQAVSLASRVFYRMDSCRLPGLPRFEWPQALVRQLGLAPDPAPAPPALGLLAEILTDVQGERRRVLLPLRIGAGGGVPRSPHYTLWLVPNEELEKVHYTVGHEPQQSSTATYLPAGRPLDLAIEKPSRPGFHRIKVSARNAKGEIDAFEIWFYSD